jgi:hypothetical protein
MSSRGSFGSLMVVSAPWQVYHVENGNHVVGIIGLFGICDVVGGASSKLLASSIFLEDLIGMTASVQWVALRLCWTKKWMGFHNKICLVFFC